MPALDWGNVPSWVSPIVALVALLFAARTARQSQRSADAAHEQISYRNQKERKEQASQVAAWVSVHIDTETENPAAYLHYVNANSVPAYNFVATLECHHTQRLKIRILPPTDGIRTVQFLSATRWMEKSIKDKMSTWQPLFGVGNSYEESALLEAHGLVDLVQQCGISVQFQDSHGFIWRRGSDGFLREATVDEDPGWAGTTCRDQNMRDTSYSKEGDTIFFDILEADSKCPQRTEILPNVHRRSQSDNSAVSSSDPHVDGRGTVS